MFQQTQLEAFRCLDRFDSRRELGFFFWLCGIARKLILNRYRQLKRRPPILDLDRTRLAGAPSSADLLKVIRSPGLDPQEEIQLREHLDLLAEALQELPENHREAILLRYVEGWDNQGAADLAGVSPGAFRVRLSRALVDLRRELAALLREGEGFTR